MHKLDETQQQNDCMHSKIVSYSQVTIYLRHFSHFHIIESELEVTMLNFITITITHQKYVYNKLHEKKEQTCIAKQCQQTEVSYLWRQTMSANRSVILTAPNHVNKPKCHTYGAKSCQQTEVSYLWCQTMVVNVNKPKCHIYGAKAM